MKLNIEGREVEFPDEWAPKLLAIAIRLNPDSDGLIYARVLGGPRILLHRLIAGAGEADVVDHINGNTLDNRTENLRICTHAQNARNRKKGKNNTFGFKGIWWDRQKKRFRASISLNGKKIRGPRFKSVFDAAKSYDSLAKQLHGDFARLNFSCPCEKSGGCVECTEPPSEGTPSST